ncbi:hypothetical protein NCCP1664_02590 [Zafaria cholistanensis]|uniref:Uncharacterized protein n=2 Tax=Zafaria cholistanensis TaxID=1682741 RepID=A0A5A7NNL4_9MICC|nr:hypothetical protein NCCP1664_02590 [Zafaria cholistanensis]
MPAEAPRTRARAAAPLRIRTGRLAVALAGLAAVVVLVVCAPLALMGAVGAGVPGMALAVLVASFAGLRSFAVRDRRRKALARMEAVFAAAMSTPDPPAPVRRTQSEVFDVAPAAEPEPAPTLEELRAAARRVAAAAEAPAATTWDPVEVPLPTYVGAAKAGRPEPAPLPEAAEKKPSGVTSILQDTRAAARAAQPIAGNVAELPGSRPGAASPATGRINLDAVLQRRRA